MRASPAVLVVEDQVGEILWLLRDLQQRGYEVVIATNERAAQERLDAVKSGTESYALAIFDIAVAILDIEDLIEENRTLDEKFLEDSVDTGLRLCEYARRELEISAEWLPIVCLSVRAKEVEARLAKLGIPAFERIPHDPMHSIRTYLDQHLPSPLPAPTRPEPAPA